VRFEVVQGAYRFATDATQTLFANSITVTSDERGVATAVIRADTGAPFQIAGIRATDITSNAFRTSTFFIRPVTISGAEFATVPASIVVTGPYKGQCSSGTVDYLIFGGTPPYTIRSSATTVAGAYPAVTAVENPSKFSSTFVGGACTADSVITFTVTDSTGLTLLPTLTLKPGVDDVPAPTLAVVPQVVSLGCGQQAQVVASVTSGGPNPPPVTATVATGVSPATALTAVVAGSLPGGVVGNGSTVTLTRGAGTVGQAPTAPATSVAATISFGAGSAIPQIITVNTQYSCP
jgi:hypothetical protein